MLCLPRQACIWRSDIHEGFVNDEKTAVGIQLVAQFKEFLFANDPSVRIIRVDHNREVGSAQFVDLPGVQHRMSGMCSGLRMLGISWAENDCPTGRRERRHERQ